MNQRTRLARRWSAWALAALTALAPLASRAQAPAFPSRPVTMLLPLATGSAGDVALRLVAQKMAEGLKQAVVIENQPGAAGLVGTERVVRAAPDGYFVGGLGDSILNYAINLSPRPPFDPLTQLESVAMIATIPWTLAANAESGPKTLADFVARARANPGTMDYGSTGVGSASHIGMEMFASEAKLSLHHVPYRGATPAVNDAVAGHVPAVFSAVSVVLPFIRSGKLVALAVPAEQRSPLLPDVPTFAEAGVPGFNFTTWVALFAPRGTPRPVIDRLNAEANRAINDPQVRERLLALGLEPKAGTPEMLGTIVATGHKRIAAIIKQHNIKAE